MILLSDCCAPRRARLKFLMQGLCQMKSPEFRSKLKFNVRPIEKNFPIVEKCLRPRSAENIRSTAELFGGSRVQNDKRDRV
jgi:hypothetical protein